MRFPSTQERAAQIAKLVAYFQTLPDGEYASWMRIESDTGISMANTGGRNDARTALRKTKRPYESLRGEGVRLSSPTNAISIVRHRFDRIDNAVRVADKTQRQLQERHLQQMSPEDQRTMIISAGFFGAIRAMVRENGTKILKSKS